MSQSSRRSDPLPLGAEVGDDLVDAVLVDDPKSLVGHPQPDVALLGFEPYCRFGRKRRRVLLLAWETLLPLCGRFPVTWQTLDMANKSLISLKVVRESRTKSGTLYQPPGR